MSETPKNGTIGWFDLTVKDAKPISEFYSSVVGWEIQETPVDDYHDYTMCHPETKEPQSGICHQRGQNSDIPPQWMMYVYVDDLDHRAQKVKELGGKIIKGPTPPSSYGRFAIIEDPQGSVLALFEASQK